MVQYSQPLMAGLASAKGFLPDIGSKWVSGLTTKGVSETLDDVMKGGVNTGTGTTGNISSGFMENGINSTETRIHAQFEHNQQFLMLHEDVNNYEPFRSDWENRAYHTRSVLLGFRRTSKDD
jgi:hypothetical protein